MSDSQHNNAPVTLQILATSDVHGALLPSDGNGGAGSLARVATLVRRLRRKNRNCLLFDNGDFLQGSAICDFAAHSWAKAPNTPHPVIRAMNQMGYDAVGLGNHEFDYGLPFLKSTLQAASFATIASNVTCEDQPWVASHILNRRVWDNAGRSHHLRIGVLSVLPEQVTAWNARQLEGELKTSDIVGAAQNTAKALRDAGADIIVCLAHSGLGGQHATHRMENAALPIAKSADIDVLICGHVHKTFPDDAAARAGVDFRGGQIYGVPTVMPGHNGAFLGQVTLSVSMNGTRPKILHSQSELLPLSPQNVTDIPADTPMTDALSAQMAENQQYQSEIIGHADLPLHNYFSRLPGDPAVAATAFAQLQYTRKHLGNYFPAEMPIITAACPVKGNGQTQTSKYNLTRAGAISRFDLAQLQPFANTLEIVQITGLQLREWLEKAASTFTRISPRTGHLPLRDTGFPCYTFDTVFGVTYEIDLTQRARYNLAGQQVSQSNRISNLCLNGQSVANDRDFAFVTNSYRTGGGGNYPNAAQLPRFEIPRIECRDVMEACFAEGLHAADIPPSPWAFRPIADTRVNAIIGDGVLPLLEMGHSPKLTMGKGEPHTEGFTKFPVDMTT